MPFVTAYHRAIEMIVSWSGQTDKFIHIQLGLLIWLGVATLSRRSLRSWLPLTAVIVAEIGNEVLDRLFSGAWNWPDTLGDAAATWLWPVVLTLSLRSMRWLG